MFAASMTDEYFNSTMVRLKATMQPDNTFERIIFQFHYGTIKRKKPAILLVPITKFQFHYGTIKSNWAAYLQRTYSTFQFHYGTIKSQYHVQDASGLPENFNSTMVRLKVSVLNCLVGMKKISIPLWYD